jgi:hypothetical protein
LRWRLVDRVVFFQPWEKIAVVKQGTFEEYRLMERWGCPNIGPPLFLLESAFQAAAWLVEASTDFEMTSRPIEVERFAALPGLAPGEGLLWRLTVAGKTSETVDFKATSIRFDRTVDQAAAAAAEASSLSRSPIAAATDASAYDASTYDSSTCGLSFKAAITPLSDLNRPEYRRALWAELVF